MSDTNILREYLLKLGFKVDEAQMKKWDQNIKGLEKGLNNLSKNMAAVGVVVGVAMDRVGRKLDELYFASKRTGASATNIRAFGYAVSQLGGDAGDAQNSLEAVARLLRNAPGAEGLLAGMGVQARDAKGNLRDMTDIFKDLAKAFQGMDYYKANAFAEALGIDERTLMAMRSGDLAKFMDDQVRRAKEMGLDAEKAAKLGHEYAQSMREVEDSAKAFGYTLAEAALPTMKEITGVTKEVFKDLQGIVKGWRGFGDFGKRLLEGIFGGPMPTMDGRNGVVLTDEARKRIAAGETAKLPASTPAAPAAAPAKTPAALFANLEAMFGLPAGILDRMWKQESGRGKNMLSPKGAQGHFQFMPGTAKQYGLTDPNDLNASATAAARYLKDLLAMFGGDINKAVAAYNWGPGNVQRQGLGAMPAETRGYLKNVAGGVQVTQQTSIVVQGSSDPYATGQAVANQQNRVAQDAIRNFAPLVR